MIKQKKILEEIDKVGFIKLSKVFDRKICKKLLNEIKLRKGNRFFKSLGEFKKKGRFYKTNPDKNFNYLNNFDHKYFDQTLKDILPGTILNKKIIRNVRVDFLPPWLKKYKNFLQGNINAYIKDKYQNETHFFGIHNHQDGLGEKKIFITAYIYLDNVNAKSAPLCIYEKTHLLHLGNFPVFLKKIDKKYLYFNNGNSMFTKKRFITGQAGDLILFDSRCVHTTDINTSKHDRISLRYLVKNNHKVKILKKSKHISFGLKDDHLFLLGK